MSSAFFKPHKLIGDFICKISFWISQEISTQTFRLLKKRSLAEDGKQSSRLLQIHGFTDHWLFHLCYSQSESIYISSTKPVLDLLTSLLLSTASSLDSNLEKEVMKWFVCTVKRGKYFRLFWFRSALPNNDTCRTKFRYLPASDMTEYLRKTYSIDVIVHTA